MIALLGGSVCGLLLAASWTGAWAADRKVTVKRLVMLPLENRSGNAEASLVATRKLRACLEREMAGEIRFVDPEQVEEFLAARRIRRTDSLSIPLVRKLGKEFRADAVLMGSVDLCRDGESPQVGMNLCMVNTLDGFRLWSTYVSLDGRDFTTILCLGEIDSLDRLWDRAVEKAAEAFQTEFEVQVVALQPFHLVRAEAVPRSLGGGQVVQFSAKFSSVSEVPAEVTLVIGGEEIAMDPVGDDLYEAAFRAPEASGFYEIELLARDSHGNLFTFPAGTGIEVDNEAPVISLVANVRAFSPGNHKARDHVLFFPRLQQRDTIERWQFDIFDGTGRRVRTTTEEGPLPNGLIWRGEGEDVAVVEPGEYECVLSATDSAGNRGVSKPVRVRVDTAPPLISVEVHRPEGGTWTFRFDTREESGIQRWRLTLFNQEGEIVKTFFGEGDLPLELRWEVEPAEPGGTEESYTYGLEAVDVSGNRFRSERKPLREAPPPGATRDEAGQERPGWDVDF